MKDARYSASASTTGEFFLPVLVVAVLATLGVLNLLRSPPGALRRHPRFGDFGAEHGHPPGTLQDDSFAISAALAGVGGALYAHKLRFLSPTSSHPAVDRPADDGRHRRRSARCGAFGAIVLIFDAAVHRAREGPPAAVGQAPGPGRGLRLVLIAFVLFEPLGLYGRWLKIRTWFQLFPRSTARACSGGRRRSRSRSA